MAEKRYVYIHREDMRKWQEKTLEVQQELQRVFDAAGIDSWCGGGTLIGAVRNQGFLCWDNDLDMFFLFNNYKKVMLALRESGLIRNFDIYHHENGYWRKNQELHTILEANELDEAFLDLELSNLSKGMFKVFDKNGVSVQLYLHDYGKPEDYIKIAHFSKIHMTRYRIAKENDSLEHGSNYFVMPNVCMLPMITEIFPWYISSFYIYLVNRVFTALAEGLESKIHTRDLKGNNYSFMIDSNKTREKTEFEALAIESMRYRARWAMKNTFRLHLRLITLVFKKVAHISETKYVFYKTPYFRFQVLPYRYNDIFPIIKMPFSSKLINVPNNYDEVLRIQFGDYTRVPVVEKRVAYPFFIQDRMGG